MKEVDNAERKNDCLEYKYEVNRVTGYIKSSIRLINNIQRCEQISITNKTGELNLFISDIYTYMCIFKCLCISRTTIIMRKTNYLINF